MKLAQGEMAYMITEQFFWPDRGGADEQRGVYERQLRGFEHRQKYVDAGKAIWFARVENSVSGVIILKVSFEELQQYFQADPFYGIIKREVVALHDASKFADHFRQFTQLNYKERAKSPIISGDLSIGSLVENMRDRLADTDTNY